MEKKIVVVEKKVKDLKFNFGNPRKITNAKKEELEASLETYGDFGIILIDENDNVIAGNNRAKILLAKDPETIVLCKQLIGYTEAELRAINIKDNTHNGEWDLNILADWTADLNIDLGIKLNNDSMQDKKIEDKETIIAEIERIGQIILDLGIGFCAEDASIAPWNYTQEFTFKGTTGAMRWYNKYVYKSRFDEKVYHNCDLDVMLHELLVNRIILRPMYFCVNAGTDTNKGGNSSKTRKQQMESAQQMKLRWGRYFDYNWKNNKPKINVSR